MEILYVILGILGANAGVAALFSFLRGKNQDKKKFLEEHLTFYHQVNSQTSRLEGENQDLTSEIKRLIDYNETVVSASVFTAIKNKMLALREQKEQLKEINHSLYLKALPVITARQKEAERLAKIREEQEAKLRAERAAAQKAREEKEAKEREERRKRRQREEEEEESRRRSYSSSYSSSSSDWGSSSSSDSSSYSGGGGDSSGGGASGDW